MFQLGPHTNKLCAVCFSISIDTYCAICTGPCTYCSCFYCHVVTEKVWETDSTSASDVSGGDSDDKKPIVPPVPKPSTKGGKKKQSSLLMFAKKVTKTS